MAYPWQKYEIQTIEGEIYKCHFAPDWNEGYFTSRWRNKPKSAILEVLKALKKRRKEKIDWFISGNEIWVYDNNSHHSWFHKPKERIVNDIVFDRLLNGKPEPTNWDSGKPQTTEVWAT